MLGERKGGETGKDIILTPCIIKQKYSRFLSELKKSPAESNSTLLIPPPRSSSLDDKKNI